MVAGLSTPPTFFGRRFRFVADESPMVVFFAVQPIHGLVSFGTGRHFNEPKTFGTSGKLVKNQFATDDLTEGGAQSGQF